MLKIFLRITIFLSTLFNAVPVLAVDKYGGLDDAAKGTGLESRITSIPAFTGSVLARVLGFTGTIFFVLVIVAGLIWMTSAGNEEKTDKARKILIAAVIGLIIILSAYAITKFVGSSLG